MLALSAARRVAPAALLRTLPRAGCATVPATGDKPAWDQRLTLKPLSELPPLGELPPVSELPPSGEEASKMKWEFGMGGLSMLIIFGTGYLMLYEFGYRRRRLDTAASHRPLAAEEEAEKALA